jgi:hypothetical protein
MDPNNDNRSNERKFGNFSIKKLDAINKHGESERVVLNIFKL